MGFSSGPDTPRPSSSHVGPKYGTPRHIGLAACLQRQPRRSCARLQKIFSIPSWLLNPHVGGALRAVICALPVQLKALTWDVNDPSTGGVSPFAYSGTIVHAVLAYISDSGVEAFAFGRSRADSSELIALGLWDVGKAAEGATSMRPNASALKWAAKAACRKIIARGGADPASEGDPGDVTAFGVWEAEYLAFSSRGAETAGEPLTSVRPNSSTLERDSEAAGGALEQMIALRSRAAEAVGSGALGEVVIVSGTWVAEAGGGGATRLRGGGHSQVEKITSKMKHQLGRLSLRFATLDDVPLLLALNEFSGPKKMKAAIRRCLDAYPSGQACEP